MAETPKRGRGRPRKTDPKPQGKTPLDVIKQPRDANLPNNIQLPEGDNNKYTSFALAIMQMPKIDFRNPDELRTRVLDYFQLCADHDMKPGVAAVALAIGLDRRRLWEMRAGKHVRVSGIPQECVDIINGVYDSLEALWESYMISGKINPVSGIFLGKNNCGYQDKQEYVLTPNQMDSADPETIRAKYDELPED